MRIQSQAWLAMTLSALGVFTEGRRQGEEALRLATRAGRGSTPMAVHGCLNRLYLAKGDLEDAIRVGVPGLALCRASGNRVWLRGLTSGLGYAYALQGRRAEGRALLEEGLGDTIRTGALQNRSLYVAWLSEVCRLAGHRGEAWQYARHALDLARQCKERGNEALALHQLGAVHAHAVPPDLASAEATTSRPWPWPRNSACARYRPTATSASASCIGARTITSRPMIHLTTATAMYREMDMRFWLEQAEPEPRAPARGA